MILAWLWGADASAAPLILILALLLEAALGEMAALFRRVPHPVALIGRGTAALDRLFNAPGLPPGALRGRGALTVAIVVGAAASAGLLLALLFARVSFLWPAEAVAVSILLAGRSLYGHVREVAAALEGRGLAAGREAVSHIVGRDPASLDAHGVARAAVESLAENFSDGLIAPAFWYLLLGLPGMLAYKAVNTLDSMIGHRSPRHLHFGMVAARLDDVANLVPARLSGLLISLAAVFMKGASAGKAFSSMLRDAGRHRSPNAGWPEAAMAGALNLKLAGPRTYRDETVDAPFIGPGTPGASPADIRRALRLYVTACVCFGVVVLVAAATLR